MSVPCGSTQDEEVRAVLVPEVVLVLGGLVLLVGGFLCGRTYAEWGRSRWEIQRAWRTRHAYRRR